MRIFPAIDLKNGQCVRLKQGRFDDVTVYGSDPVAMVKDFVAAGASYIHMVDLDGARTGTGYNQEAIKRIIDTFHIPVQTGGGIRNMRDIEEKISIGVSRVIIGTAAVDNPDLVKEAVEILENNGYEVVGEAEDGLDAITVCRQKKPDFVIMDINMPVMTGLEATKVINEDKLAGFVIILTAYRDKEIADQAVNTDVMGYIVKPVDEDTLIPAVKIAIHNYKQREAMAKEFHKTQEALDDRKYLDRAKGLVMERKNMSEKEAYTYIRSLSMDKGISMTELSKMLLKAYES